MNNNEFDDKLTRCPRLGQEIKFSYCRQESGKFPCARIVNCWSPCFDVEGLLRAQMSPEIWQKFVGFQPMHKIVNIIELIEAAKKRK